MMLLYMNNPILLLLQFLIFYQAHIKIDIIIK